MSLIGTIYHGTTGLMTYSNGLDVISNNVANLNTPGFKRNDLLFRDLFYQSKLNDRKVGNGVTDDGTMTSYTQGDIQQTGNQVDAAVDGNGFFVLRGDNETYYTRVGQFDFDDDYYLISTTNNYRVAGIDMAGNLMDINIADFRTSPAGATTEVTFVDNLSFGSTQHVISNIEVFDTLGDKHQLTLTLTNNSSETPRSWLGEIEDENSNIISTGNEIRFQVNGSPQEGFNQFSFEFAPEDAELMELSFFFGEPGSISGATYSSAGVNSTLAVGSQDGFGPGVQASVTFNRDGVLEIEYSNGQNAECGRLALAWLNNLQSMQQIGNGLFALNDNSLVQINAANENGMGEIISGSVEISNVELSQEFTDLVIIQRGYQVSSQVVSIANEMLQQLLDSTGSKR